MKKRTDSVEKEIDFYHWLLPHSEKKLSSDLYTVLPIVNAYGKSHKSFKETLFEIGDVEHALKFYNMVEKDKRFRFMNYGQINTMLLFCIIVQLVRLMISLMRITIGFLMLERKYIFL